MAQWVQHPSNNQRVTNQQWFGFPRCLCQSILEQDIEPLIAHCSLILGRFLEEDGQMQIKKFPSKGLIKFNSSLGSLHSSLSN